MDIPMWLLRIILRLKNFGNAIIESDVIGAIVVIIIETTTVFLALGLYYRWTLSLWVASLGITMVGKHMLDWGLKYASRRSGR